MANRRETSDYAMLRDAIKKKNKVRAQNLIRKSVNVNISDTRGDNTLLHWAIIKFEDIDILTMLLDKGANVNAINHNHDKPLDVAIQNNKTQAAILLIKRGALVRENLRPLLLIAIEKNNHKIVKNLIHYGMQYNPSLDLFITFNTAISRGVPKIIEYILPHCRFLKPSDKYIPKEFVLKSNPQYKDCVQLLLKWNFIVNPTSNRDTDFIYGAVANGHLQIVLQLLKLGIDVDLVNSRTDLSLLKVACMNKHYKIVKHLLNYNSRLNVTTPTNIKILDDPSYYYCNSSLLFSYNKNNLCGLTCLHIAVLNSDPMMTNLLLRYGAKIIDDPTFFNITCIAVRNNCEDIVRIFLDLGVNVNDMNPQGESLLHFCVNSGAIRQDFRYNMAKMLLERGATIHIQTPGNTLIFEAIKNGYHKIAQLFLDYNADIQYISPDGDSLLHKAIENNFDENFIKILLKRNSPVDAVNKSMLTPLLVACKTQSNNQFGIIKSLLDHNANINCTDNTLKTPLHIACHAQNLEVITILLEKGANPNATNDMGQTPIHFVCAQEDKKATDDITLKIIQLLLQYNANIEAVNTKGRTPLFIACEAANDVAIKCLLDNNANVNHTDLENLTPLYFVAHNCKYNSEVIKLLLERNANVHLIDNSRKSIIHVIIDNNDVKLIEYLANTQVNFNFINKEGDTPLHIAVQSGSFDMTKSLIKYGANVNILDKKNRIPLRNAIKYLSDSQKQLEKYRRRRYSHWEPRYLIPWQSSDEEGFDADFHRNNIKAYKEIIQSLKIQVVKLKIAGIKVNNQNLKIVFNSDHHSSSDDEFSDQDDVESIDILQLEVDCELEIERMKMESISVNNITFNDLLKRNLQFLRRFAENKKIQQTLEQDVCDEMFPLYTDIVRSRFRDAKLLHRLINSAKKYFRLHIYELLPDDCTDAVFSYLNMKDIKKFIRAIKPLHE